MYQTEFVIFNPSIYKFRSLPSLSFDCGGRNKFDHKTDVK